MFRLIFGKKDNDIVTTETQRQIVERALDEINTVMAGLDTKPRITFDPASGEITMDLPVQMPDEAAALPAPDTEDGIETAKAA